MLSLVTNTIIKAYKVLKKMSRQSSIAIKVGNTKKYYAVTGSRRVCLARETCLADAAIESFFGTLESELYYLQNWTSVEQLKKATDEYIHYYNHERIKSKLKGLSPIQYRTQALAVQSITCPIKGVNDKQLQRFNYSLVSL